MCEALTMMAASFAIGAVQTVTGFVGAQQQADAQNQRVKQNQEAAQESLRREYEQAQTREIQEEEAAAVQKQDIAREARAARASTLVAAGEGGVSGLSVDNLLADVYQQESTSFDRIDQNTGFMSDNLKYEMRGLKAKAQDRINSMPWNQGPSPFAAALKIGGSALNTYQQYDKYKNRTA